MSNTHIHIDRLHINSQGIPSSVVQAATQGLGQELLTEFTQQTWTSRSSRMIGDLQLGNIPVNPSQDVHQLRQAIVQAVLQATVAQTQDGSTGL